MTIPRRIRDYLDSQNVPYETLHHSQAFGGQERAHTLHVSGKRCVKAVVVKGDERALLAVIPASHRLNLQELSIALKVSQLDVLPEGELEGLFPDCELGAVPPLGKLYGIEVWVDRAVADTEQIVFCAGTHEDCIRMRYADFARLVQPRVGRIGELAISKAA